MSWLLRFWSTHKISTHSIMAFLAGWVILYNENTMFHDWVMKTYQGLPDGWRIAVGIIASACVLYWRAQKEVGTSDADTQAMRKAAELAAQAPTKGDR